MKKPKSNKKKKILIIIGGGILLVVAVGFVRLADTTRVKICTTFEELQKNANSPLLYEVPAAAADCRFAFQDSLVSKQYLYSFTLDDTEYQEYIQKLVGQYELESQDEQQQNYSYAQWYGMKVADCNDDYGLDHFPVFLSFNAVSDTPIEEYTIIVYYPVHSGNNGHGLVALPDEHRIVCYEYHALN